MGYLNIITKDSPRNCDVNLTDIFQGSLRNQIYHYFANGETSILVDAVSKETDIPKEDLLYKVLISPRKPIYYAHPKIAEHFKIWCEKPPKERIEEAIQARLENELGGLDKKFRVTDVGTIDVLTETLLIEVKFFKEWKEGIGQLILYGLEHPNHKKVLHLFGSFRTLKNGSNKILTDKLIKIKCKLLKQVCNECNFLDIRVDLETKLGTDFDESNK
jgi:hypothetical protein